MGDARFWGYNIETIKGDPLRLINSEVDGFRLGKWSSHFRMTGWVASSVTGKPQVPGSKPGNTGGQKEGRVGDWSLEPL